MYHYPDSHSTKSPEHTEAMYWIIVGLMGAVATFMLLLTLIPN